MTANLLDDVVARGRKTVVRCKRLEDAADEYRWRSDPELALFDASRPVQTPFENYERNWAFDFRFTDMPSRAFAIEDAAGRHIGNVMYYNIDQNRSEAEIGISIGERDCWENGYGSDALAAVARALLAQPANPEESAAGSRFAEPALRRLYLHTLDWNVRAQRSFRRAGFQECGTSWRDGNTFVIMELCAEHAEHRDAVRAAAI